MKKKKMIKGIDISHQNTVNWSHLSPEIKFVFAKATQGKTFKDNMFNQYWQHLRGTDLLRGAYHFLSVNGTAQEQAANFLSCGIDFTKPGVLPPMLDIEDQVGNNSAETKALNKQILNNKPAFIQLASDWLDIVSKATGRTPIIYSYKGFFNEYLNNHSWPNPLWLASYQASAPGLPKGWQNWTFWQYTQYGMLDGRFTYNEKEAQKMGAEFDLDYFNGDIEALKRL